MITNFKEDYTYAGKKYKKTMEKYRDFFSNIFKYDIGAFGYIRLIENGNFVTFDSSIKLLELACDTQSTNDDPLIAKLENVNSGGAFVYKDYNTENVKHNSFLDAIKKELNTKQSFLYTEKHNDFYEVLTFAFVNTCPDMSLMEHQNIFLQNWFNNAKIIKACFEQFKKEMSQAIENKDLYRLNFVDLKDSNKQDQQHLVTPEKNTIQDGLMKAGIIEPRDLMLQNIKFSPKEKKVIRFYLQGLTSQEIAEQMHLSSRTIEGHLDRIKNKLGVKKKVQSSN